MPYRLTRMIVLFTVLLFANMIGQSISVRSAPRDRHGVRRSDATSSPTVSQWRRTSQGWQRTSSWALNDHSSDPPAAGKIHPVIVASLIGLLSLGALVGFGSPRPMSR